jgi:hypothetical protein
VSIAFDLKSACRLAITCQDDLMEFRAAMERLEKDRSLKQGIIMDRLKENEKLR